MLFISNCLLKIATDIQLIDDNWLINGERFIYKHYSDEFQLIILTFMLDLWTISLWSYLTR